MVVPVNRRSRPACASACTGIAMATAWWMISVTLASLPDDAIAFDLSDANGYYLFDNLQPNRYMVGVDTVNFAIGGLLEGYNSSTGSVDNAATIPTARITAWTALNRANPVLSPIRDHHDQHQFNRHPGKRPHRRSPERRHQHGSRQ